MSVQALARLSNQTRGPSKPRCAFQRAAQQEHAFQVFRTVQGARALARRRTGKARRGHVAGNPTCSVNSGRAKGSASSATSSKAEIQISRAKSISGDSVELAQARVGWCAYVGVTNSNHRRPGSLPGPGAAAARPALHGARWRCWSAKIGAAVAALPGYSSCLAAVAHGAGRDARALRPSASHCAGGRLQTSAGTG